MPMSLPDNYRTLVEKTPEQYNQLLSDLKSMNDTRGKSIFEGVTTTIEETLKMSPIVDDKQNMPQTKSEVEEVSTFHIGFDLKRGIIHDAKVIRKRCGHVSDPEPDTDWTHPNLDQFDAQIFIESVNNVIYTYNLTEPVKFTHRPLINYSINFLEIERQLMESSDKSVYDENHKKVYEQAIKDHIGQQTNE